MITAIITCLFLISCGTPINNSDESVLDPHSGSIEAYKNELNKTGELLSKLIVYFDNKDKESIKALFSAQAIQNYDIDSQIDKVFEFYDGRSVSFEIDNGDERGYNKKDGKYVYVSYEGSLRNIITDNQKSFEIWISRCPVNDDNPSEIGLNRIILNHPNGTHIAPIGEYADTEIYSFEY